MIDAASAPIRIVGIGNVLMGDDGLGPYTVEILRSRFEFPAHVELEDGGTPGLDFLPYISDARCVIVVDTVASDAPAGTVKVYRDREIIGAAPPPRLSPHQPGLREALMAAELTDRAPGELVLVGVVPENVEQGTRLSASVAEAVERVIGTVLAELARLESPAVPRPVPLEPATWWAS